LLKSLHDLQEKLTQNETEEMSKLRALKLEREKLAKENQTLMKKLERSESYLEVSKELANNLQQEKRILSEQMKFSENRILEQANELQRVNGQNSELQERVNNNEKRILKIDEQLDLARNEVTILEKQLFQTLALAIKLDFHIANHTCGDHSYNDTSIRIHNNNGNWYSNISIAQLSEEMIRKKVPRSEWYMYIVDTILAEKKPLKTATTKSTTTMNRISPSETKQLVRRKTISTTGSPSYESAGTHSNVRKYDDRKPINNNLRTQTKEEHTISLLDKVYF